MIEAHITNSTDAFVRNVVEVVVGRQTERGLYVERIEPISVEERRVGDETDPIRTERIVQWAAYSRFIAPTNRYSDAIEDDPVTYRVHRTHVREVGLALLAYADGDNGGPPGDARALRADLDAERFEHSKTRERLADLTDVLARIAEREPLVIDPVIVEPVVIEPKVHVLPGDGYGITITGPSTGDLATSLTEHLKD